MSIALCDYYLIAALGTQTPCTFCRGERKPAKGSHIYEQKEAPGACMKFRIAVHKVKDDTWTRLVPTSIPTNHYSGKAIEYTEPGIDSFRAMLSEIEPEVHDPGSAIVLRQPATPRLEHMLLGKGLPEALLNDLKDVAAAVRPVAIAGSWSWGDTTPSKGSMVVPIPGCLKWAELSIERVLKSSNRDSLNLKLPFRLMAWAKTVGSLPNSLFHFRADGY